MDTDIPHTPTPGRHAPTLRSASTTLRTAAAGALHSDTHLYIDVVGGD